MSVVSAIAAAMKRFDCILIGLEFLALFRERVGPLKIAAEREVQIHALAQA